MTSDAILPNFFATQPYTTKGLGISLKSMFTRSWTLA